jgi:2-furoyl-CoA dehydrogenase large subunit
MAAIAQWSLAELPDDLDPGLHATATFSLPGTGPINERDEINVTGLYPFMVDVAVVEVDVETGR